MQSYKNIKYLVDKLNKIHNNKYDYSLSICRNNKSIIVIKCPLHGMFEQRIDHHLNGCGCQTCSKNKKLTTDVYIQRSKEVHGKVYDYSKVVYTKSHDYVTIGCYKHGWFRQVACDHINNKMGCKDCYLDNNKLTSVIITFTVCTVIRELTLLYEIPFLYAPIPYLPQFAILPPVTLPEQL